LGLEDWIKMNLNALFEVEEEKRHDSPRVSRLQTLAAAGIITVAGAFAAHAFSFGPYVTSEGSGQGSGAAAEGSGEGSGVAYEGTGVGVVEGTGSAVRGDSLDLVFDEIEVQLPTSQPMETEQPTSIPSEPESMPSTVVPEEEPVYLGPEQALIEESENVPVDPLPPIEVPDPIETPVEVPEDQYGIPEDPGEPGYCTPTCVSDIYVPIQINVEIGDVTIGGGGAAAPTAALAGCELLDALEAHHGDSVQIQKDFVDYLRRVGNGVQENEAVTVDTSAYGGPEANRFAYGLGQFLHTAAASCGRTIDAGLEASVVGALSSMQNDTTTGVTLITIANHYGPVPGGKLK
jgi:hypothetical protein